MVNDQSCLQIGDIADRNCCPDMPKLFLYRFRNQPWRCSQCGQFWVTELVGSWGDSFWTWKAVKP